MNGKYVVKVKKKSDNLLSHISRVDILKYNYTLLFAKDVVMVEI